MKPTSLIIWGKDGGKLDSKKPIISFAAGNDSFESFRSVLPVK